VVTRTNSDWLNDLSISGPLQEAAIADLREFLLRAALYAFSRNLGDFGGLSRNKILHLAEDCAQDALIAVMEHLSDFRGDSQFTTWAYKFSINIALMAARRERWKGVSLDELSDESAETLSEWNSPGKSADVSPEDYAEQQELRDVIHRVITNDLTAKQRQVLSLMVFNEVPMDEVVRHLGTNRNAVYKLLHDARQKLKSSLQAEGFGVSETLDLFAPRR
jgi:RNA polymerase sigma-70 factor, ECF subfamily